MPTKLKLSQVNPTPASASNSTLTGTPTAPTPSTNDDSTKIATTAYVKDNLDNYSTTSTIQSTYLPISGGAITGPLYRYSATNKKFHICDGGVNDATLTNVDFGWSWDNRDGSGFAFRSVDFGNEGNAERGAFIMWARDASNSYSLTGKCDGSLNWSGLSFKIGSGCTLQYNSTNQRLDFIFT